MWGLDVGFEIVGESLWGEGGNIREGLLVWGVRFGCGV